MDVTFFFFLRVSKSDHSFFFFFCCFIMLPVNKMYNLRLHLPPTCGDNHVAEHKCQRPPFFSLSLILGAHTRTAAPAPRPNALGKRRPTFPSAAFKKSSSFTELCC